MQQPTSEQKRSAVLALAAMVLVGIVVTGLFTAGAGALLSLGWNAAIARPLGAPELGFFAAWGLAVLLGFLAGGTRIALSERARRRKPI